MKRTTKIILGTSACTLALGLLWFGLPVSERTPVQPKRAQAESEQRDEETGVRRIHHEAVAARQDTSTDPMAAAYAEQMEEVNAKLDKDPVAKKIPMLFDLPKAKQLETLDWMLELPRDKLVSALPDVAKDATLSPDERRTVAVQTVQALVDDLRAASALAER
jgi:hypothetical protein